MQCGCKETDDNGDNKDDDDNNDDYYYSSYYDDGVVITDNNNKNSNAYIEKNDQYLDINTDNYNHFDYMYDRN